MHYVLTPGASRRLSDSSLASIACFAAEEKLKSEISFPDLMAKIPPKITKMAKFSPKIVIAVTCTLFLSKSENY